MKLVFNTIRLMFNIRKLVLNINFIILHIIFRCSDKAIFTSDLHKFAKGFFEPISKNPFTNLLFIKMFEQYD